MSILQTIDIDEFLNTYMVGVARFDNNRCAIPRDFYQSWLRAAAAYVAKRLDLGPILGDYRAIYSEEKDHICWDLDTWTLKSLYSRPLLSVEEMAIQLGDFEPAIVHPTWVHIASAIGGQIVVIRGKASSTLSSVIYGWHNRFRMGSYIPLLFRLKVKAGFERLFTGTVSTTKGSQAAVLTGYVTTQDAMNELNVNPIVLIDGRSYRVDYIGDFLTDDATITVTLSRPAHATLTDRPMVVCAYPDDMRAAVQQIAAIPMLAIIGSWLHGKAGVSKDMGQLDALMRSKSLNIGKGFGPYSAQAEEFRASADELLRTLYDIYGPINAGAA